MKRKIEVHNPNNLPVIDYARLESLQKDLKTIDRKNLSKLKRSIIRHGIFVPKFVWVQKNHYWICDGHQTVKALGELETEGFEISKIPYVEIKAKNKKNAGEKLLQLNSHYGIINPETLFFDEFDLDLSYINDIEIPELEILINNNKNKIEKNLEIEEIHEVIIECVDEIEQEKIYNDCIKRGYRCRILIL